MGHARQLERGTLHGASCGPSLRVRRSICQSQGNYLILSWRQGESQRQQAMLQCMLSNPKTRPSKCCGNDLALTRQDLHLGSVYHAAVMACCLEGESGHEGLSLDHRVDTVAPSIIVSTFESPCLKHSNTRRHGLISES